MKITKAFLETVPSTRLIGRRYTDSDRVDGSFGAKWGEAFNTGLFATLESTEGVRGDFDYLGAMRIVGGVFEYWIGMLFEPDAPVPRGLDSADIDECQFAVFYIYGSGGEIFGETPHNACLKIAREMNWKSRICKGDWFFERYNCPRYTAPDENGNVVLDYYIAVE